MKLLVTGGTGFVGTHVLQQALAAGHEVVALRRPGSRPRLALPQQPRWVDLPLDAAVPAEVLRGVDVLVHLAAHTPNPPYDSFERCLYWNVAAPLGLAEQAHAAGVERFVVAGSCFEYGSGAARHEFIPVDAPLEPELSYPASKAAASVAFAGFARRCRVRLQILRIFHVYGEGEAAARLWPSLRAAALAGHDFEMSPGEQVRDFVEVGEVARQFVAALAFDRVEPGQPCVRHVASGRHVTLAEFARRWWEHWGARGELRVGALPYRDGELMRLVPQMTPV